MGALVGSQLVFNVDGTLAKATPFTVWDDEVAGSQITGNTMPDGITPAVLVTQPDGLSPQFRLPNGQPVGFIDIGASARQALIPAQTIKDAATAKTSAEAAAVSADAAKVEAAASKIAAQQAAANASAPTTTAIDNRLGGPSANLLDNTGVVRTAKLPDLSGTYASATAVATAKAQAISTASDDATAKANAALSSAVTVAGQDATDKAADARVTAIAAFTKPARVATSASRALALTDVGKVVGNSGAVPIVVRVPLSTEVTFDTNSTLFVQGGRYGCSLVATYWNAVTNPNPTSSSVGYSPRSNSTLSTPNTGTGVRSTATASGSFGAIGELIPLSSIGPKGVRPGDKISVRSTFTLGGTVTTAGLAVRWQAGAATLGSEVRPGDTAGSGDRFVTNVTVPNGADGVRIIYYSSASAAGATADYGKTMVSPTDQQLTTYADGDTAGCSWYGNAGGSVSSGPMLRGQTIIPAGGEVTLRYLGSDTWNAALAGVDPDTLKVTDTLVVDPDRGQSGSRAPNEFVGKSSLTMQAGRAYGARLYASKTRAVTVVAFNVETPANVDVACEAVIYDASGTRVATSGAQYGKLNGSGVRTITIPTPLLVAGSTYYATLASNLQTSGAVTATTAPVLSAAQLLNLFGSAFPQIVGWYKDNPGGTDYLSGSTISAINAVTLVPFLAVRES